MMKKGSLVLRGGRIIDPATDTDMKTDLHIENGEIFPFSLSIHPTVIDVSGLIITPGLVDIHSHLFATGGNPASWVGDLSVNPDCFSFRSGVTTMVDAGSSGWRNYDLFHATVIERAKTRVFAMLNVSAWGMVNLGAEQRLSDMIDTNEIESFFRWKPNNIVGIKTAHYEGHGWEPVERAVQLGDKAGLPVMVDFGYFVKERPYWQLVTEKLRKGDISTHCFRSTVPITDEEGKLYPYLTQARERGVFFDLGHGAGSFDFRRAAPAIEQEFYPDSISTDLHADSMNGAMMDMPNVISKLLALGMPLDEAILRSTYIPACMIGHSELGNFSVGAPADVAVWNIRHSADEKYGKKFGFKDNYGGRVYGTERLECELTLKGGEVVWDRNARSVPESVPTDAGIREGEVIVRPAGSGAKAP
ncbi:MAG: amidohydrolase/deacetylase family metallohydrolase [Synergistaceae bacterium]|jgi:dihydroorotase|nr:amidohydrolase/deacetylase family metallohydrolase [Synergistaceae bacterium]